MTYCRIFFTIITIILYFFILNVLGTGEVLSKINTKKDTTKSINTNENINKKENSLNIENSFNEEKKIILGEKKNFKNYLSENFKNEKKILDKDKWTWRPGDLLIVNYSN